MAHIWPTTTTNPFDCRAKYRLITQRSQVQILPPQPKPNKITCLYASPESANSLLAHLWPTGFCAFYLPKFSTAIHPYLDPDPRLHHGGAQENLRILFLRFSVSGVTVLVLHKVTFFVSLCQSLSPRTLCVALLCAKGAPNENPSGFINRLCSFRHACVYAGCHAQSCAGSRTARTPWYPAPMSSGMWCVKEDSRCQASAQVGELMQGALVWGRLAY